MGLKELIGELSSLAEIESRLQANADERKVLLRIKRLVTEYNEGQDDGKTVAK